MEQTMEASPQPKTNILEVAWNRFAQYDASSYQKKRIQYRLNRSVAIIAIMATLFAILSSIFSPENSFWISGKAVAIVDRSIDIVLILLPILGSIMAAFINKLYPATDWLVLRAGAEQIMKEILMYRTILQTKDQERRVWLETRLREIQNEVFDGLNGEMIIEPYSGKLPPPYDDGSSRSDPGFSELAADEYYKLRLKEQLDWHKSRVNKTSRERIRLQAWILLIGGAGTLLAALGGSFSVWVAVATSISAALISWQGLRNLDSAVRNYSKVVYDLNNISDHWNQLPDAEKTQTEYYRMVKDTEEVLWNQNREYLKSMKEAVESAKLEEDEIINQTLRTRTPQISFAPSVQEVPAPEPSTFEFPVSAPPISEPPVYQPPVSEIPAPPAPTDSGGVG